MKLSRSDTMGKYRRNEGLAELKKTVCQIKLVEESVYYFFSLLIDFRQ